jgi:hypothetical protein
MSCVKDVFLSSGSKVERKFIEDWKIAYGKGAG